MKGFQEYRDAQVNTASPEQLIPLLLQEAIRRQDKAVRALEEGDVTTFNTHLIRCREIFNELLLALDDEAPDEIVANLRRLYFWCLREISKASWSKDPEVVAGLRKVTVTLFETWSEAVEKAL